MKRKPWSPTAAGIFHSVLYFKPICVLLEEVNFKYVADFQQQFGIYAAAVKNLVDIRTVTVKLTREPHHRTFLPTEFVFNTFSDKNLAHNCVRVGVCEVKEMGTPTRPYSLLPEAPPSAFVL